MSNYDGTFDTPSFFGGDPLIVGFVAVAICLLVLFCLFRCRRIRSNYHNDPFPTRYPSNTQPPSRFRANEDLQYIHVMSPLPNRVLALRSQTQGSEPLPKYEAPPPDYEDAMRDEVDLADIGVVHDEVQEGMSTHQTIPEGTVYNTTSDSIRREEGEDLSRGHEV